MKLCVRGLFPHRTVLHSVYWEESTHLVVWGGRFIVAEGRRYETR
jgi:hypothetical protein